MRHRNPTRTTTIARTATVAALCGLVLLAAAAPAAGQSATPRFVVALDADGSATVTVTYTFDLTDDAEREAFRTLADDESAREDLESRFVDRLRAVANDTEETTGRSMAVTPAGVDLRTTDDEETGVVALSAAWSGLAEVRDGSLVVGEPFASEFTTDRPFVLRAPDGYSIARATPEPTQSSAGSATWAAGADLDGFEVVLEPESGATTTADVDSGGVGPVGQPGFGVLGSVVALVALVALAVVGSRLGPRRRG